MNAGKRPFCSVLIASLNRPRQLSECLESLTGQTVLPGEVVVAWQGLDHATRERAEELAASLPFELRLVHSPEVGIVPAENAALLLSRGEVIFLIDDDAKAPQDWIEKHLAFYKDPAIGAVGGPVDNFSPDGKSYPKRTNTPVLKLAWSGKVFGNAHDQDPAWRKRPPMGVDHLIGSNMSFRRGAISEFEARLRPFWQQFEVDACLQIKTRGFVLLFDFSNVVEHHPKTNWAYVPDREGDLNVKIYNPSFNHALILSKHSAGFTRWLRLFYMLLIGSVQNPGLLGCLVSISRYGRPFREWRILAGSLKNSIAGWNCGAQHRSEGNPWKEVLRRCLPARFWTFLRLARLRMTLANYPVKRVSHIYGGYPFQLSLQDPMAQAWYDQDWMELPEIAMLKRGRLKPGSRVFNLGMHQGVIALMLSRIVAPKGMVVALEASAHNAKVAQINRDLNDARNLTALHAAVARVSGKIEVNMGLNAQIDDGSGAWGKSWVDTISIDDLSARYGLPDVLYMDIEGYELEALLGAENTLRSRPDCFIEVHIGMGLEKFNGSAEKIFEFFSANNYELYVAKASPSSQPEGFVPLSAGVNIIRERFHLVALAK